MRLENTPVTCQWTAEQLNDKTLSFVPSRTGIGPQVVGQMFAAQVGEGLYIQVALKKHHSPSSLYWLSQEEANRLQPSVGRTGVDFILA